MIVGYSLALFVWRPGSFGTTGFAFGFYHEIVIKGSLVVRRHVQYLWNIVIVVLVVGRVVFKGFQCPLLRQEALPFGVLRNLGFGVALR